MSYASKAGRARVSSRNPQAQAVCMRCGIWHNRVDLNFQYDWRGTSLQNLYLLVCDRCLDMPQEQLRAIALPADPTPIYFPSVEAFEQDETNCRAIPGCCETDPISGLPRPSANLRITEDLQNRITQPIGAPDGLDQNAVMPYNGATQKPYGVPLYPLSIIANGTDQISVTFLQAHGLNMNDQIAVQGVANRLAAGFFSVVVSTPMAFTYQTYDLVPAGPLLTATTRMVTCLVGLPYGSVRIPQVGP